MRTILRLIAFLLLAMCAGAQVANNTVVPAMLDQNYSAGTWASVPVSFTGPSFNGMTYVKLEFSPLNTNGITSCTVWLDSQDANGVWSLGGAIGPTSCAAAGSVVAGPLTSAAVKVEITVAGSYPVRVRLSSGLSTYATAGSGTITGVTAGTGLTGGGVSGSVTLSLANVLTAGSCTSCNLTYNAFGQITVAANGSGGSMTWPAAAGITVCTGSPCTAWGTSLTAPTGTIVGTTDTQTLTSKTLDGVTPATMAFLDATSSIQTQLNAKLALAGGTMTGELTTAASGTGSAGFNLPPGTAPTSPVNGDCWTTSAGLFCRIAGVTVGPYGTTGSTGLSGMTAGQVAIAATASTVTSSKAIQGSDTNLLSSGTISGTGASLCTDASGGATTSGCSGGSSAFNAITSGTNTTAAMVVGAGGSLNFSSTGTINASSLGSATFASPAAIGSTTPAAITGTTITANTGLTINGGTAQTGTQGTDTKLLTASTVSGTGAALCTDASGGATTTGCSGGTISGMTALGWPIAATSSTITSSTTAGTNQGTYIPVRVNTTQGTAVAGTEQQVGIGGRAITGATASDTVLYSDVNQVIDHDQGCSAANTETLDTPANLHNTSFGTLYWNQCNQTDTLKATTNTIQVNDAAPVAGATGISVAPGQVAAIKQDPNLSTNWLVHVTDSAGFVGGTPITGSNIVLAVSPGAGIAHFAGSTQTVTSSTIATGDIAANAVTLAKLATQGANTVLANVSGSTAVPTAAAIPSGIQNYVAGTGYNQATAHQTQSPDLCADSSGSGTAQTCTFTPALTPATNDYMIYTTTTTNSGAGLTIAAGGLAAKSVAIPGASGWTTTLTANIIPANKPLLLMYDGTNWNVLQTGTAASGGGGSLSTLTAATGANTLANGNFGTQIWNWAQTTNSQTAFTFGDTTAATGTSDVLLQLSTLTTSTEVPFQITQGANGPASAAAPAIINVTAAAAGGLASGTAAGNIGAGYVLPTGAGSAGSTTGAGGAGGAVTITEGTGGAGAGAASNGGAGGGTVWTLGTGGAAGTTIGIGGIGGAFTITGGNGGASTSTSGFGGVGSAIGFTAGTGGADTASGGTGGAGGPFTITTGNGGASGGTVANPSGGNLTVTLGKAGVGGTGAVGSSGEMIVQGTAIASLSSASVSPNAGTLFAILGLIGGANSNASGTAGSGSIISMTAGNGGAGTGTNSVGGAGAAINLTAGNGGASLGTGVNSSGGSIVVTPGAAGTGGSGTAGLQGVLSVSGAGAGAVFLSQGAAVTTANTNIPANSIIDQAPTAVTAYTNTRPGTAAQGIAVGTLSGSVITQGYSGDANHSATVSWSTATSVGSTSLCSSANCPAGTYRISAYIDVTTACTTTGSYLVNVIYTDDTTVSKTAFIPLEGTGATFASGVLVPIATTDFGTGSFILRSTGATSINYSTTAAACGSGGPGVGKLYLTVEPIQ